MAWDSHISTDRARRLPEETANNSSRQEQEALRIAVETGFHSLIELVARHEKDQDTKNSNVEVLKKLKPDAGCDKLEDLLHSAAVSGRKDAIHYLLEIGAKPNERPNGGSSALESCLWRLRWGHFNGYGEKKLASKYDASGAVECISELPAHGAV